MKRLTLGLAGLAATAFLALGGTTEVVVTQTADDAPAAVTADADATNIIW